MGAFQLSRYSTTYYLTPFCDSILVATSLNSSSRFLLPQSQAVSAGEEDCHEWPPRSRSVQALLAFSQDCRIFRQTWLSSASRGDYLSSTATPASHGVCDARHQWER